MKKGTVVKSTGSWYFVRKENEEIIECRIRGKIRLKGIRTTNPVAVGDIVDFQEDENGCVITKIHPRQNYIIRKSTNLSKDSHIIASNIDQAILIATINYPETSPVFIDRFLASAEAYNIPAALCFNKTDLYSPIEKEIMEEFIEIYSHIGYPCYPTSIKDKQSMENMKKLLSGKTSVLSGVSGVGKSSIINTIYPKLNLKTASISESHNTGKHTTTFAEMFALEDEGYIIDTPGLRSFGAFDMKKEEISHYFREIFKYSENCRFNNCTHLHEPGCAVIEAIEKGEISESRYSSYLSMMEETDEKYR